LWWLLCWPGVVWCGFHLMLLLSQNWASYVDSNVPSSVHTSFSRVYFETFFFRSLSFSNGKSHFCRRTSSSEWMSCNMSRSKAEQNWSEVWKMGKTINFSLLLIFVNVVFVHNLMSERRQPPLFGGEQKSCCPIKK
jgi:hypothetical protein